MSSNAIAWARQQNQKGLNANCKLLLRELAEYSDPDGYISNTKQIKFKYETLAEICGVSRRTVANLLNKLEELNLIERIHFKDGDNGYTTISEYRLKIPHNFVIKIGNLHHEIEMARNQLNNNDLQKNLGANGNNGGQCKTFPTAVQNLPRNNKRRNNNEIKIIKYIPSNSKNEFKGALVDEQFNQFWKAYPKSSNKTFLAKQGNPHQALKAFKIALKTTSFEKIIIELKKQIEEFEYRHSLNLFNPQFKHASTWLNQKCWDNPVMTKEEIDNERSKSNSRSGKTDVYEGYNLYDGTIFDPNGSAKH